MNEQKRKTSIQGPAAKEEKTPPRLAKQSMKASQFGFAPTMDLDRWTRAWHQEISRCALREAMEPWEHRSTRHWRWAWWAWWARWACTRSLPPVLFSDWHSSNHSTANPGRRLGRMSGRVACGKAGVIHSAGTSS